MCDARRAAQGHDGECTEAFYKSQVGEALRERPVVDEAVKKRTKEAVKRYMTDVMYGEPEGEEGEEEEGGLPPDLQALFEAIALGGADVPLDKLPEEVRREFERAVADGSLSASIPGQASSCV